MQLSLVADKVATGYDGFSINGIGFNLSGGDIFGLLGRSGSGKSTIIKAMLGQCKLKNGSIIFSADGKETVLNPSVGYSPQRNALFPYLTVEENLMTYGKLYGMKQEAILGRTKMLLARLDLNKHRSKRITQLSGGMEKRADLACALIHDPDVIILDEPFNGLDVSLQGFIWQLLRELSKGGKIIIISSHFLEDIQRYCTKFGLVENGQWYDDSYLRTAIKKERSLQLFLAKLFQRDLDMERGGEP